MKLYNTLSRKVEDFKPLKDKHASIYSCGPTVYDHIHIGNLSSFIAADMLRRALQMTGYQVKHVMNFTDVDDKTIRRSLEQYTDIAPEEALKKLTEEYAMIFLQDMVAIGNDVGAVQFVKATDNIEPMRELIHQLYKHGFAYATDDGVYFSIEKYKKSGKQYGQLLKLNSANTSAARIDNDEYDKESVHDFALWKTRKAGEPAWEFKLDGHDLTGRPGWHIECSAMSVDNLGQPFDIHTGGVDLIFPHHENEIAQSTALHSDPIYARYFVHNEHLLVDGKKMSKSLNNFFTLRDIQEKGYDPLAFRLMMLQAHYRSQTNFTWDNLEAAQNRLKSLREMADLRWQVIEPKDGEASQEDAYKVWIAAIAKPLLNDLNTPEALAVLSQVENKVKEQLVSSADRQAFELFITQLETTLGLSLFSEDISKTQKDLLKQRQAARDKKQWAPSDKLRDELIQQNLGIRDTDYGQIWFRL
ncbi:MAG TPA: cysteine--tRNA ligase [Patescibacteria group bacterium]|nr:cysteine--tRNA ligase [Patescibacteria group bacterium]